MPPPTWLGEEVLYEQGSGPRYWLRAFDGKDNIVGECGGDPPPARRAASSSTGRSGDKGAR